MISRSATVFITVNAVLMGWAFGAGNPGAAAAPAVVAAVTWKFSQGVVDNEERTWQNDLTAGTDRPMTEG